jgi:hypothetical protein
MEATKKFTDITFDFLVYPRLNAAGITLFKRAEKISSIKDVIKDAEREFLTRHQFTAIDFLRYCFDTMTDVFTDTDKTVEMVEYLFIIGSLLGYKQATTELVNIKYRKTYPEFSAIKTMFSEEEFEQIGALIKETLIKFPNQCKTSMDWMIEHPPHAKIQTDAMMNFAKALQDKKSPDELEKIARKVAKDAKSELLGNHSIFKLQKLEQFGLLPPGKEVIATIERIMNMLDIMHYGGYINTNTKSSDPALITFEKWF